MEEDFSVYEYVKDNFIGLLLLFISFIIIYVVEHITQLNNLILLMPLQVPIITNYKKLKNTKYKK